MGTPHERFRAKFVPLLGSARDLPHVLSSVVGDRFPQGVAGDSFPNATVQRLLFGMLPLYHAAVAALDDPETSLGALALMRGLIEAWAQLYFLMGNDDGADAACRAIRLEVGWAAAMVGLARAADSAMAD